MLSIKPRFLLDEHLDRAIQRQLHRLNAQIEVLLVGDPSASERGLLDPELLIWLEVNGYILVTNNRKSMPGHLVDHYQQGHHIPGIFWISPDTSLGRVIEELYLIWLASDADEYTDRMLFIPLR